MFFRNAAAAIHPKLEVGRPDIPEIVIHHSQEPSIQHHSAICEMYTSATSGKGMLWRGWVGKFTPKGRGVKALNIGDNVFGDSTEDPTAPDDNCRQSHGDDLEGQTTLVSDDEDREESGNGLQQWWEMDCGGGEEEVSGDASDSEEDSEEGSEEGEAREDDGRQWWETGDEEEEISADASDSDDDSDSEDFEMDESDAESGDDESGSGSESESESETEENSDGLGNSPSISVQQSISIAAALVPRHVGPSSNGSTASSMSSPTLSDDSAPSTPPTSPGTPIITLNKRELIQCYNLGLGFEDIWQAHDSYQRSKERVHRMLPEIEFMRCAPDHGHSNGKLAKFNHQLEALDLEHGDRYRADI